MKWNYALSFLTMCSCFICDKSILNMIILFIINNTPNENLMLFLLDSKL